MTKLRDYYELSDKIETFCGRPQVAPTNKFENQQLDKSEFDRAIEISLWMWYKMGRYMKGEFLC